MLTNLQSPFKVGIKPKDGTQYINTLESGNSDLTINTSIENAEDIQRIGVVVSLPIFHDNTLQIGDEVVVHHNVFRITYNDKGIPMNSNFHLMNDLFFVDKDMIYLYIRNGEIFAYGDAVFLKPFTEETKWEGEKIVKHQAIVKYTNDKLKKLGVPIGTKICHRKNIEYIFKIFGEELYKTNSTRILATLE
jgi:hypothetical protein